MKEPKDDAVHDSDCALHNMPAYPNGECDCSAKDKKEYPLIPSDKRHFVMLRGDKGCAKA